MGELGWKYYIVYCCWLAFEFVVLFFSVIETVGKNGPLPLEVTNFLFDGEDKTNRLEQHGRRAALQGHTYPPDKGDDFISPEDKLQEEQRVELTR